MRVSVLQENIAHGLGIVGRAVSPRSTLPVLANVLVASDEGRLRLSATNLELGITCWIGAKIEEEGSTTVPARTFSDLVNTLPNGQVDMDLAVRTQNLNVRSDGSNTDIKCIDAQEFPPMSVPDMEGSLELDLRELKEMIQQVVFTASGDDARPVLTGVLVTVDENQIIMAAADGFRLSVRKAELANPVDKPFKAIIPARALSELARVAGESEEKVQVVMPAGRNQVIFRLKDIELTTQLIEGAFPEYQQIIPADHKTRTVISTAALLKASKQAEIFAREGSHIARLNVTPGSSPEEGAVEVSAQSEETGSNETLVEAKVEGDPILIAFNVRFLREVLDVIQTPNISLETSAATSPGVIRPMGEEDYLHVIMPMHLGN
ncbi:MAG: DNA polymerase III subunit beta [Anaerolineae bacterium]|nr:DNA polymerase III subunit beta [Anaerolineae bacterium]